MHFDMHAPVGLRRRFGTTIKCFACAFAMMGLASTRNACMTRSAPDTGDYAAFVNVPIESEHDWTCGATVAPARRFSCSCLPQSHTNHPV